MCRVMGIEPITSSLMELLPLCKYVNTCVSIPGHIGSKAGNSIYHPCDVFTAHYACSIGNYTHYWGKGPTNSVLRDHLLQMCGTQELVGGGGRTTTAEHYVYRLIYYAFCKQWLYFFYAE